MNKVKTLVLGAAIPVALLVPAVADAMPYGK